MILKQSFQQRFIMPVGFVLLNMILTLIIYNNSWRIASTDLHRTIAYISGVILFLSIAAGTLFIYPLAFFRGAGPAERIIACLITPIVWNLKEILRVSQFFSLPEALYYGLNSAFLLSIFLAFGQMGFCEMVCRWWLRRFRNHTITVLGVWPVICVLVGLAAFYVIKVWGDGVHWFYIYQEGYKLLFF